MGLSLLSDTLAAQTEQDWCLAQLTDELAASQPVQIEHSSVRALALKSALFEQPQTNAAEAERSAELSPAKQKDAELGRLQAKLDELSLPRGHVQDVRARL
jgi:hypothetical protein